MQESLKKIKSLKNLALDQIICYSNIGRNRLPNTRKVSDRMIALGSDHGGYKLKEEIKRYLEEYNKYIKMSVYRNRPVVRFNAKFEDFEQVFL